MRKKFVYICSPLSGDIEKNIIKAQSYCRNIAEAFPDVVPIAPHIYCTQFLDDTIPDERSLGIDIGLALLDICDEVWVYGLDNPSTGMKAEINYAEEHGIPVLDGYHIEEMESIEPKLGDAVLIFSSSVFSSDADGAASSGRTKVTFDGEDVVALAKALKRAQGSDVVVDPIMEARQ